MVVNKTKRRDITPQVLGNQTLVATSALSSISTSRDGTDRYAYELINATSFYVRDLELDTVIQLQSPNIAPVTGSSLMYTKNEGFRGNCLGASTNTIDIPGLDGVSVDDLYIRITSGKGLGQRIKILSKSDTEILDSGILSAATTSILTDNLKKREINGYIGYAVRLIYGGGISQMRKILYHNETALTVSDANYQQLECWNNTPFSILAPYTTPLANSTYYQIELSTLTLTENWTTIPDETSSFCIESGGLWLISSTAVAPWSSLQFYDRLTDTWATKTPLGGLLLAALGTDFAIEGVSDIGGVLNFGNISSATARTITVPTPITDSFENMELRTTNPATGVIERSRIVGHSTTVIQVEQDFEYLPDNTRTYEIYPNTDNLWLTGNGSSSLYQYKKEKDIWSTGSVIDIGQCRNMSVQFAGQEAQAISTGVRSTSGITVLNPTPTVAGTGYVVGDIFNITTGGTVGKGRVEAITPGGIVTQVSLYSSGINYTTGAGKVTTNVSGIGTGLTVNITTIGTVGRITTVGNTNFYKGDAITIKGCTESAWNTTYNILAVDSLSTFDIIITATANASASFSQSTTLVVDSTKNYVINGLKDKLLILQTAGTAPITQIFKITSNTATTITVPTIVAGANGTSRFLICEPRALGRHQLYPQAEKASSGYATGGSTTTLIDTNKNWNVNQWAGYKFDIISGTGFDIGEITIVSNTATTLTYTTQTFTPNTTTRYLINDTFGIATAGSTTTLTDTTKNWKVNELVGRVLIFTSGTGRRVAQLITANTATVITYATGTAPDTTTCYTILGVPPFSTGIQLMHLYNKYMAKYLAIFRGGATNTFNLFNMNTGLWEYTKFISPQSETFTTGCSYWYDGEDYIYIAKSITGDFIRIMRLNVNTWQVEGGVVSTQTQGTVHIGNVMIIYNLYKDKLDGSGAILVADEYKGKMLLLVVNTSRIVLKFQII